LISGGVGAGDGHGGGVDLAAGSIAGDGSTAATVVGSLDGGSSERAPPSPPTRYLVPSLAPNERLRLTLLWYHTEGIEHDVRLLSKIDTLVKGVQKAIGWEYAIAGILSESTYTRLATANLPIALLPRRESTCAHTINQAPRTIFMVTDMSRDWRFRHSPHVEVGGLRSYAGTQLRLMADDGAEISLGSLCVASDFVRPPLSPDQQEFLVRFAELISSSIASHTRQRRLRTRQRMTDLLSSLDDHMSGMASAEQSAIAIDVVSEVYPRGHVSLQVAAEGRIIIEGRAAIDLSDVRDGIWEDTVFIEESIRRANHGRLKSPQAVRAIVARCGESDKYIVVASRDIHHVFDDFDAWFVGRCATAVADSLRNQLLKQALEARETFMRGITHQLRTPIHGILGSVELLEEELTSRHLIGGRGAGTMASTAASTASSTASTAASTANTPSPAWSAATSPWPSPSPGLDDVSTSPFACISAIKNAGLELRTTINNILKHNHWNAGLRQCRPVPYDLRSLEADVLPGVLSILQPDQLSGLSVHFALDFSGGRSVMMTDSLLLRDSLEAILLNAVQAVLGKPDGAVVVKVRLGDIAPAGRRRRLTVDVVDNGCGIDVASHDKIFEPYEKVDSYKPGAGLGLTVAARISAALNGCVRLVSSAPGAGSCFRLEVEDVVAADDMMPPVPGLCVDEDATAGGECERADLADPAAALGDPAAQALFLPRTYTDIRTGPAARHFVDHTIAFLEQHGFRRNDAAADVGLVVTNVGPDRVASVIAPAYPDAVVVWCGEKERHRRGSLAPSPSGLDSMPGCISLIGGPLHTQRLKEMLRMAEDLYRERKAPAAGKRKRKGKKGRRRTGEAGPGASASAAPSAATSAAPSAATSAAPSAATSAAPTPMEEVSEAVAGLGIAAEAVVLTLSTETTAATDVSTLTPPPTTSTPPPPPPLRALLVDDNPINLRILQMFCKRRSIPHVTATDGNKAIAAYLESYGPQPAGAGDTAAPITLVFMDLQMPHCDGLQATTTIRAWERDNAGRLPGGAPAKVFMVTGQDAEVERDGAMRAGADEFLVKPVGPAELDRVVEKYFPDFRK
jgi:signal transduction histidine kinase/CheY-like chemotaxis protein